MSSFIDDEDEYGFEFSDENVLVDEEFLQRPIDVGLEIGEEGEVVQEMEATFQEGLQKEIDIGELDPRNPKDKPLILIGQEMRYLNISEKSINDFLMGLRARQDDTLLALPYLNARYVTNAKVYLDEEAEKADQNKRKKLKKGDKGYLEHNTPKTMQAYIKRKNNEYKGRRESQGDPFPYLDKIDFYRYIKIDEKIFN